MPKVPRHPTAWWVSLIAGLYVLCGGIVSLSGWILDLPGLTDWEGNGISIQPNATVCAIAAGASLLCLNSGQMRVAAAAALLLTAIGSATLFEHATGLSLAIDQPLMFGHEWGRVGVLVPGRMGPPGSLSWTVLGIVLCLAARRTAAAQRAASRLVILTLAIPSLSLIGYAFGASTLYALPRVTIIAFQTASFIFAGAVGAIAFLSHYGLGAILSRDDGPGLLTRRLLLPIVAVPLILAWIRLRGERAGYFDLAFGIAVRTLLEIAFLASMLCWTAWKLAKLEDSRRATEATLRDQVALMNEAHDAITLRACDGTILTWNNGAREMYGYTSEEALGRPAHQLLRTSGHLSIEAIDDILRREHRWEGELRHRTKSGDWIVVASRWAQLLATDDRPARVIEINRDITAAKRAAEALQQADQRKDEFLATLAHELRNPLAPISNALHVLRMHDPHPAQRPVLEMMERQLRHLVHLVDDLLDVSRITRGRIQLQEQQVDIAAALTVAIEASRPLIDARKHSLRVSMPGERLIVDGDAVRLTQVFGNLLNNACKYTPPGGEITLTAQRRGHFVQVSIKDTGNGIPKEMLHRVFDLFTRVDRAPERLSDGLGIGLHLVRRLVELHGGTVAAHSEGEERGSEFVVCLPCGPSAADPATA